MKREATDLKSLCTTIHTIFMTLLWAVRALSDFLISYMTGKTPGESVTFLNVNIRNRERAVKASVGTFVEAGVSEALKGVNPFGFRRLLSNAAGELAGNLAALASSDEELSRSVGETLCSAFAGSKLDSGGDANAAASVCHASVVFVRGPLCVLRVRVSVSSEAVCSLLALTAGPTAADWWRYGLHELLPSVVFVGPACARIIDAAARTGIATLLCRQCTSAVPVALTESFKGESGLDIDAQPTAPCAEAEALFELIGRCDSAKQHANAHGQGGGREPPGRGQHGQHATPSGHHGHANGCSNGQSGQAR